MVTSPTGAVIRDILHRLSDRFPSHVLVWPVLVQGQGAAEQVAAAVAQLRERHPDLDLEDYTSSVDAASSPPRYVIYLELVARHGSEPVDRGTLERWAVEFDELLSLANPMVVEFREGGFLGRPRLAIVGSGTFARLADLALAGDHPPSRSQLKTPRRVDHSDQIDLLRSAIVISA